MSDRRSSVQQGSLYIFVRSGVLVYGRTQSYNCLSYTTETGFDSDKNNLKKIKAHGVQVQQVEHALSDDPIVMYSQDTEDEIGYQRDRLLAIVLTERGDKIRASLLNDLDAGQKRQYFARCARVE
jgi:uncharacterized DUF497 family protein